MYRITAVALALALTLPATAAEKFDPDARARAVAPFLDGQTLGVAHVDLTRVDADALLDQVAEIGKLEAQDLEESRRELRGWLADFSRAGGTELYVVFSTADALAAPPFVVVPLPAGADGKAVARELARSKLGVYLRFETVGQAVVGAGETTLKRLRTLEPVPRPEVAKAFAAAGDTVAQALLLSTPDSRRVLDELVPALPPEAGGGPSAPLTHGLRWAALGVDLPPQVAVRLVMQSPDADAATALAAALTRVRDALGRQHEVRAFVGDFDRLATLLTPKVEGDRLTASPGGKELLAVLPGLLRRAYRAAERRAAEDNLRQLVTAMHNYADTYKGRIPAVANFDKQGKPLLSWRVHILPFVGEGDLYKQFHLDEPWDSAHNRELVGRMPRVYQGTNRKLSREGKTIYLAPVGKGVAFTGGPEGARMPADFPDGTANTILLVEADDDQAVTWTRPEDLKYDPKQPQKGLGGHFEGEFLVALADGSVRFLTNKVSKQTLQAAFTRSGGEVLGPDW
jgi:hypothetical protein